MIDPFDLPNNEYEKLTLETREIIRMALLVASEAKVIEMFTHTGSISKASYYIDRFAEELKIINQNL